MFGNIGLQAWYMSSHNKKHQPEITIEQSERKVSFCVKDLLCGYKNVLHKFHNKENINYPKFARKSPFRQAFKQCDKNISPPIASIVRNECGKIAQYLAQQEQHEEGKRLIWEILACSLARLHGQAKDYYFSRSGLRPPHDYLKEIGWAVKNTGIPCKECDGDIWVPQREGGALPHISEIVHNLYKNKGLSEADQAYLLGEGKKNIIAYVEERFINMLSPFAQKQNLLKPTDFKKQLTAITWPWLAKVTTL